MSTHVTHKRLTLIYMSSYLLMWLHQVIFGSQGALAGVQGVAAVAVNVDGLPLRDRDATNEMEWVSCGEGVGLICCRCKGDLYGCWHDEMLEDICSMDAAVKFVCCLVRRKDSLLATSFQGDLPQTGELD